MLVKLLGNFLPFILPHPCGEPRAQDIFRFSDYLDSFIDERHDFLKEFITTNTFATFIEQAFGSLKNTNEVTYFVEAAKAYKGSNEKDLAKRMLSMQARAKIIINTVTSIQSFG